MARWALVADIGGTHARFALWDRDGGKLSEVRSLLNAEHETIEAAIQSYLATTGQSSITAAAIAMAGPAMTGGAQLTNGTWGFRTSELKHQLGLSALHVLNDYEALALSLPELRADNLVPLGGNAPNPAGVKLVMGPGTGFGGAALVPGPPPMVLSGEPGHTSLPVRDAAETQIAQRLADPDGHVPVENAVSGPGLLATYQACAARAGWPATLTGVADVVAAARSGGDPAAIQAMGYFLTWLGRATGNAAMLLRADGGVYIGGGIAPRMLDLLSDGRFRRAFEGMGRMTKLMRPIPVYVIVAEAPALLGAAARLRTAGD
jgi:glucokinase